MERPNIKDYQDISSYIDSLEEYIDLIQEINGKLLEEGWKSLEGKGLDKKLKNWN